MSEYTNAVYELPLIPTGHESFSYDGYHIVRRDMLTRSNGPAAIIRKDSITFNAACLKGMEGVVYIEILINKKEHDFLVTECDKDKKDAQRWCVTGSDKRKTRRITSRGFTEMLFAMMHWSDKCRYRVPGELKEMSWGPAYCFDLKLNEMIFEKNKKVKTEVPGESSLVSVPSDTRVSGQED